VSLIFFPLDLLAVPIGTIISANWLYVPTSKDRACRSFRRLPIGERSPAPFSAKTFVNHSHPHALSRRHFGVVRDLDDCRQMPLALRVIRQQKF